MKRDILIADSDEAFASVLAERLAVFDEYRVTVVHDGNALLEKAITQPFDLLILDVALQDSALSELLERIRTLRPLLRIMVVPYPGNKVPSTLQHVPVYGVLPKPFMTEELPHLIRHALEAETALPLGQMAEVYDPRADAADGSDPFQLFPEDEPISIGSAHDSSYSAIFQAQEATQWNVDAGQSVAPDEITISSEEATPVLRALGRELQAVLVVLSHKANLLAHTSSLPRERVENFCRCVAHRVESGAQLMRFLDAHDESIATLLDEGRRYRVYTTQVTSAMWLTVVLELHIPVGSLRYHIRKAVEQLAHLSHKE
ncbi:MAG: response regulator [Anaerolineae bacterium]|nr:response regulator [Anaerolineae bacterium]MDW8070445.1 response regulator [Anaerolineae bacterium]